jgi:hypothetical protein
MVTLIRTQHLHHQRGYNGLTQTYVHCEENETPKNVPAVPVWVVFLIKPKYIPKGV